LRPPAFIHTTSASIGSTRWARRALYVRGHRLKMPLPRLAWHLIVKSVHGEENTA
jgi:hypothetical protein